jgi:hypothetical protein
MQSAPPAIARRNNGRAVFQMFIDFNLVERNSDGDEGANLN